MDAISIANDTIYGLAAYVQSATDAQATAVPKSCRREPT